MFERRSATNFYIYVAGQFGNQLFQRTAGEFCKLFTHDGESQVTFLLDRGFRPSPALRHANILELSRLESRICGFFLGHGSRADLADRKVKKQVLLLLLKYVLFWRLKKTVSISISNSIHEKPRVIPSSNNQVLIGYFQDYYWESFDAQIRRILTSDVLNVENDADREFDSEVVLHIRHTDYFTSDGIGVLPKQYFLDGLSALQVDLHSTNLVVYTDDAASARDMLQGSFPHIEVRGPEVASAAVAFEAIRCAKYKVISNSSFSWWAAYLSAKSGSKVIHPHPWFRSLQGIQHHPSNWISVGSGWRQ